VAAQYADALTGGHVVVQDAWPDEEDEDDWSAGGSAAPTTSAVSTPPDSALLHYLCERLRYKDLSDSDLVEWTATDIIKELRFNASAEAVYRMLTDSVAAGRLPASALYVAQNQTEGAILDFMDRLARRLDELRPWPQPPFRKIRKMWKALGPWRSLARLKLGSDTIEGTFTGTFEYFDEDGLHVMVLELGSGETVAIAGSNDQINHRGYVLAQQDVAAEPTETIAHFCEYSGIAPQLVTPTQ
jgi:hypothetical protein